MCSRPSDAIEVRQFPRNRSFCKMVLRWYAASKNSSCARTSRDVKADKSTTFRFASSKFRCLITRRAHKQSITRRQRLQNSHYTHSPSQLTSLGSRGYPSEAAPRAHDPPAAAPPAHVRTSNTSQSITQHCHAILTASGVPPPRIHAFTRSSILKTRVMQPPRPASATNRAQQLT